MAVGRKISSREVVRLPSYNFRCSTHGIFEAVSRRSDLLDGVEDVECQQCGEPSRMVWIKAPGVRDDKIDAVQFGGHMFSAEDFERQVDAELSFDPDNDADAFFNKPDFYKQYEDKANEMNNRAEYGDLPPLAPTDVHSQKVFADAMAKKG